MDGRFLLDTSAVIRYLDDDPAVVAVVERAAFRALNAIVVGELMFGARNSTRVEANVARIAAISSQIPVLPCNLQVAEMYASIRHGLKLAGRPIPENDIWIAATAQCHGLSLVTSDAHFKHIPDLPTLYLETPRRT